MRWLRIVLVGKRLLFNRVGIAHLTVDCRRFITDWFIKYGGMAQKFLPIKSEESGVVACHF